MTDAPDPAVLLPLIEATQGRCHSCQHSQEFPFPTGPRYWCRAFALELEAPERRRVADCPRWKSLRLTDGPSRRTRANHNPLLASIVDVEDRVFGQLNRHLAARGLDLKTVLVLAQPSLHDAQDVAWVDTLPERFAGEETLAFAQVLCELRALGYDSVCDIVLRLVDDPSTPPSPVSSP